MSKPSIGITITRNVGFDFSSPPRSIVLGPCAMLGTAVPEAPINEDRGSRRWETDVDRAAAAIPDPPVNAKSQSAPMELGSQRELTRIVTPRCTGHPFSGLGCDWILRISLFPHRRR
jgi:hypothetical protein